jgi:anti-sigma factor RsiW
MISDDDLILYYYRDGLPPADRARVAAALAEQPELAQRFHSLTRRLDAAAASAAPESTVPMKFQRRWAAALEEKAAETPEARTRRRQQMFFNYAPWYAAVAGVLIVFLVLPHLLGRLPATSAPATAATTSTSAYERGLASHLASTEQQLASLESATPEERQRLVDTIIEQNRVYALAAERAGEPQLARVLRAFSPLLESVARGDQDTSASVAQLAFELRVMQDRLAAGKASRSHSTTL